MIYFVMAARTVCRQCADYKPLIYFVRAARTVCRQCADYKDPAGDATKDNNNTTGNATVNQSPVNESPSISITGTIKRYNPRENG